MWLYTMVDQDYLEFFGQDKEGYLTVSLFDMGRFFVSLTTLSKMTAGHYLRGDQHCRFC